MQVVLNELKSAQDFVHARKKHQQQVNLSQILSSMSNNFVNKLNNNHLSPAELVTIISELETSPYSDEDTAKIISLLDEKMAGISESIATTKSDKTANNSPKSVMQAWHNYMDSADWTRFCDPNKSFYLKYEHAVHKSRSFGCIDPDEQSVKALLALLLKLHYGADQPDALQKFRYFNDFKSLFTTSPNGRKSSLPAPMEQYPNDPGELPNSVKSSLEGYVLRDGSAEIMGVNAIMAIIPMRRGSALLEGFDKNLILDACKSLPRPSPSKKSSDSQGNADSQPKSGNQLAPHAARPDQCDSPQHIYNFCPDCGVKLNKQSGAHVENTPESSDILSKIRIGGVPFKRELPAVKTEAFEAKTSNAVEPPTQPGADTSSVVGTHKPPALDAVSLAALAALQNRKEKKRAAELLDAGHTDGAKDDDDDDDDDDASGEVATAKPTTRATGKRPAGKVRQRPASKVKQTKIVMKKPSAGRSGCCKCRGLGCGKCRAKDFTGTRITRAEYLRTHPVKK